MTCVVAIVNDNGVFMGSDLLGSNSYVKENRIDSKLFKKHNMIFGGADSYRLIQLLQWVWKPDEIKENQDEMEYMVTVIVPSIISVLENNHFLKMDNGRAESGPCLLVGINNRLFEIESDYQVAEPRDKFSSIGSGEYYAKGAMKAIVDIKGRNDPINVLEDALNIANYYNPYCGGEYQFIHTKINL